MRVLSAVMVTSSISGDPTPREVIPEDVAIASPILVGEIEPVIEAAMSAGTVVTVVTSIDGSARSRRPAGVVSLTSVMATFEGSTPSALARPAINEV